MLHISTEYRKGVLFIRLIGKVDNDDYLKNLNELINEFGIKYIVLNLDKLKDISLESIEHIIKYHKHILKKKKHLLICDSNQRVNRIFKNNIPNIKSELEAFSLI